MSKEDIVAVFLDGKTFAEDTLVLALGVTLSGEKRVLGFVETDTENEKVLTPFLRSLVERGLDLSQGMLVIIDGGKGLRAAVRHAFQQRAVVQRCQWHKRENVVAHLSKGEQASWRGRLQRAYERPTYQEARGALGLLQGELEARNQSAARSLSEGLEETLTLHRLGVYGVLGRSFKTTNCLESVNALVEERCGKVDAWKNSSQRCRWLATALLDIEPRLRRVRGYQHLALLRASLKREPLVSTRNRIDSSIGLLVSLAHAVTFQPVSRHTNEQGPLPPLSFAAFTTCAITVLTSVYISHYHDCMTFARIHSYVDGRWGCPSLAAFLPGKHAQEQRGQPRTNGAGSPRRFAGQ